MKKLMYLCILLLFVFTYHSSVLADEPIENLLIEGLDKIRTEYEAGTNPETINFVEGLRLYTNLGDLAPDELLVDYGNVDFNSVGDYEVKYYVLFLVGENEVRFDIATLDIKVIDTTSPKIEGIKPLFVKKNNSLDDEDYTNGVKVTDNDKSSKLNLIVFNQGVDLTKEGIYNVGYYVQDKSGNYTTIISHVYVLADTVNTAKPQITLNVSEFNILQNTANPLEKYENTYSATDGELDLTDRVRLDDSGVDYTKLGSYQVAFIVFDDDGNEAVELVTVNIIEDTEKPYFLNLGETFDLTINTLNLVGDLKAYDEVCGDVTSRIIPVPSAEFRNDVEGFYDVTYTVSDLNGNVSDPIVVKVHVYDNLPPVIKAPSPIYLKLNDKLDLANKIEVTDNLDEKVDYNLEKNDLNVGKPGAYFIKITAADLKGNQAEKIITVYVYDDSPDVFYENPFFVGACVSLVISGIISGICYYKIKNRRRLY